MGQQIFSSSISIDHTIYDAANAAPYDFIWTRKDSSHNMIGFGQCLSHQSFGPNRIHEIQQWWQDVSRETSLLAFSSICFDQESSWGAQLVVPQILVTEKKLTLFSQRPITEEDFNKALKIINGTTEDTTVSYTLTGESLPDEQWKAKVEEALALMETSDLEKVVLSRKLTYTASESLQPTMLTQRLSKNYPQCWTFAFRGFVGATPEMLVQLDGGIITARVLAGTHSRLVPAGASLLEKSSKEQHEHKLAIDSLTDTLQPFASSIEIKGPFILELPNVWHLASDVTAELKKPLDVLEVVAKLHPTAAVGGTPTATAVELIRELENYDRGPYAGAIGWINSAGEGQFGIALRCGLIEDDIVHLYAGCGIVPGSNPDKELQETEHKMEPMRQALGILL